jgi:hypothetical protein
LTILAITVTQFIGVSPALAAMNAHKPVLTKKAEVRKRVVAKKKRSACVANDPVRSGSKKRTKVKPCKASKSVGSSMTRTSASASKRTPTLALPPTTKPAPAAVVATTPAMTAEPTPTEQPADVVAVGPAMSAPISTISDPAADSPTAPVAPATDPAASGTAPPAGGETTAGTDPSPSASTPFPLRSCAVFCTDYKAVGLGAWTAVQEPTGQDRVELGPAPGDPLDPERPQGPVMHVSIRAGDVTTTSGYMASRVEVMGRTAWPMSTTPAASWPDPVGATRWYAFNLFVPSDFPTTQDAKWLVLTQWKGLRGGSPPVAIEIKRDALRLGGARTNAGDVPNDGNLGRLTKGQWTRLVIGMRLSPDPDVGWVQVYRDGVDQLGRISLATMDRDASGVDPIYLKQGLYRDAKWSVDQELYFGPVEIADSAPGVL